MKPTQDELINALKECIAEFQCYDMQKETILLIEKLNTLINNSK